MERINTATAVPNGNGAGKNGFQDGNAAAGVAATQLNALFFNNIQEEIASIIELCGLTLNSGVFSQLAQAIQTGKLYISAAGGTSDAITAAFSLPISTLSFGLAPLLVRATAANSTATPSFTPNAGVIAAAPIVKGADSPLILGDIAGASHWLQLLFDAVNGNWVLLNPARGISDNTLPGTIIKFSGPAAPAGYLACPTAPTNISRTTYAALFSAIGTAWGVGDGATTFGMPYFPTGYTAVAGAPGSITVGQVIAHTHEIGQNQPYSVGGTAVNAMQSTSSPSLTTSSTGGASNLAAGVNLLMCVKY